MLYLVTSCNKLSKDEVSIASDNLPRLEQGFFYTAWLIQSNDTVKVGEFTVNESGELSKSVFQSGPSDIKSAIAFGISIESDHEVANPNYSFVCAGIFNENQATLSPENQYGLQNSFQNSSGTYIMATVTDAAGTTHEFSGVWWVTDISGTSPGLNLPVLPSGWIYESWVKINDQYVSTGRFLDPSVADQSEIYSDSQNPPFDFPGEDLLFNSPSNLTFPVNLKSKDLFISVEYEQMVRSEPLMVILGATIPSTADFNEPYQVSNVAANLPEIIVKRKK